MKNTLLYGAIIVHPLLQLLAEGGASAEASPAAGDAIGEEAQVAAAMSQEPVVDRRADFEKLIKGEYKDLYNERVQETVKKRLKNSQETVSKFEKLSPAIELLATKYGVDAADIDGLSKAIEDDNTFYEEEAMEQGVSVTHLREMRKAEREIASLKQQVDLNNREKQFDQIVRQSEALKQQFPSFDLMQAMQNEDFYDCINRGYPVEKAYKFAFQDEILAAGMAHAVEETKKKVSASVAANAKRPAESGASVAASTPTVDISTRAKRDEIAARVARGEKIRL